jgi:hypothetical protein
MIRRGNSGRYAPSRGGPGNDTDALQTDVMRFMSILGLCLMAVFALVQSIPQQDEDARRSQPRLDNLQQQIAVQQRRATDLQHKLEQLSAQTRSAQALNQRAQQQLARLIDQTTEARKERQRLNAELQHLNRELARGKEQLATLRRAAHSGEQSLNVLQQRIDQERQRLDDISQRADALEHTPATKTDSPAGEQSPPLLPPPGRQGFTLRFASTEALERLVAAGTVSLYAMAGRQAWRLSLDGGQRSFAPDPFPGWFHEMAPATVPDDYTRALRAAPGQPDNATLVWGVQLPPAARQDIASLTRELSGGDLLIGVDGRVRLASE